MQHSPPSKLFKRFHEISIASWIECLGAPIRIFAPVWVAMLMAMSTAEPVNASQLVAGSAREVIPSYVGDPIGVWGQTQDNSWGFDSASATALYLSDGQESITIIAVDTLLVYEFQTEYINRILRDQGKSDNIFVIASHAHATPSVRIAGDDVDLRIRSSMLSAVLKAHSAARPAKIGGGEGYYIAAFNRIMRGADPTPEVFSICQEDLINGWRAAHPNDPVDDHVAVLRVLGVDDSPIATIFNYAAHPVTFGGPTNRWGTPGYPAQARRIVESNLGGLSLFVQGLAGDISTPCAVMTGTPAHLEMMKFGAGLGSVVLSIAANIKEFDTDLPITSSVVSLNYYNECIKEEGIPALQIGVMQFGRKFALVGVSGEPFSLIGHAVRDVLKQMGGYEFWLVAGYMNSAIGYIPDDAVWGTGAYSTIQPPSGGVMCVQRDTARRIVAEVERQVDALD